MEWQGDHGLELYVATSSFPNEQQVKDSKDILRLFKEQGILNRTDVVPLDRLDDHKEVFEMLKAPDSELRLPFLIFGYACMTSAFLGYSGPQEIEEALRDMRIVD